MNRHLCSLSFDNGQDAPGCAIFKVYLDNELAYESCPADAKTVREFVDLDIKGRSELKLSVINAGGNKCDALGNWCDPVLLSVEKLK